MEIIFYYLKWFYSEILAEGKIQNFKKFNVHIMCEFHLSKPAP